MTKKELIDGLQNIEGNEEIRVYDGQDNTYFDISSVENGIDGIFIHIEAPLTL